MSAEAWMALISAVVAFFSLLYSIISARKTAEINKSSVETNKKIMEETIKHNRLSVKPMLHFIINQHSNKPEDQFIGIKVENRGIGPAFLWPPLLINNGQVIALFDSKGIKELETSINKPEDVMIKWSHKKMALLPGKEIKLIWAKSGSNLKTMEDYFRTLTQNINIYIPYTSLYGEEINLARLNDSQVITLDVLCKWFPEIDAKITL